MHNTRAPSAPRRAGLADGSDTSPPSQSIAVEGITYTVTKTSPWRYDVHIAGQRIGEFIWSHGLGIQTTAGSPPALQHIHVAAAAFAEVTEAEGQCFLAADITRRVNANKPTLRTRRVF